MPLLRIFVRAVFLSLNRNVIRDGNHKLSIRAFSRKSSQVIQAKGAVQIDQKERIFAHPDFVNGLQDHRTFGVKTVYDIIDRSYKLYGDRAFFSFRDSSQEPFRSYTYR